MAGYNVLVMAPRAIDAARFDGVDFDAVSLVDCRSESGKPLVWVQPRTVLAAEIADDGIAQLEAPPPGPPLYLSLGGHGSTPGPFYGADDRSPYAWARRKGILTSFFRMRWVASNRV